MPKVIVAIGGWDKVIVSKSYARPSRRTERAVRSQNKYVSRNISRLSSRS